MRDISFFAIQSEKEAPTNLCKAPSDESKDWALVRFLIGEKEAWVSVLAYDFQVDDGKISERTVCDISPQVWYTASLISTERSAIVSSYCDFSVAIIYIFSSFFSSLVICLIPKAFMLFEQVADW